ncbi:hypothetical protein DYBT9275_02784 [Dyadobacter sp. CECT 9275]|uniref:Uncharacterized protein n=1 Tax=Dyadobacter helix TaxID=2822344 RepID=A0A916JC90_9BACT|nr:hypothetical protein [Dyadobacter sp. CECT 9275]CAG5002004.1 hypothetical protein DYBT9275_02784 [Dyadobacter sp. CECT 9275]
MFTKWWLEALSQQDRTVALILALAIGISTVSGVSVFLYKKSEEKDEKGYIRLEVVQRKQDSLNAVHNREMAECNLEKLTIKDELYKIYLNDLKEQRDKYQALDNQLSPIVKKSTTDALRNSKNLKQLKEEVTQ